MSGILMASVGNSYGSAPVNTVAPAVTGTAAVGQTLSTTNGTWTGAPAPTFTYQWFRSPSTPIGGATSSTYVLVAGDFGFGIFCRVTATNSVAPSGVTADSNTTAAVGGTVPVNTVAPVVSGTATVGQTLTTTDGTWTGIPAPTFTYQWQRTGSDIGGATSSTYVLVAADYANTIRCVVTATNTAGSAAANSNSTASVAGNAPVNTVAPVVSGTATFGQTLSTTDGTWTGVPTPSFTYQWQRTGSNIGGATSSTYVLVAADVGNTIRCVVTATNVIAAVSANSNSTAAVSAAVPGAPTIGTATATGSTTATVSYTAPASNGGATITSYTATSSPGGITGSLATAGSGTITVSGLSPLTAYTFTVTATNVAGTGPASASSNSVTTTDAFWMTMLSTSFTTDASTSAVASVGVYVKSSGDLVVAVPGIQSTYTTYQCCAPVNYTIQQFALATLPSGSSNSITSKFYRNSVVCGYQRYYNVNFMGLTYANNAIYARGFYYNSVNTDRAGVFVLDQSSLAINSVNTQRFALTSPIPAFNQGLGIELDSSNNIYTNYYRYQPYCCFTLYATALVKTSADGATFQWSNYINQFNFAPNFPTDLVADNTNGYIYQAGTTTPGSSIGFVAQYSASTGTRNWRRETGGVSITDMRGGSVTIDASGNTYLVVSTGKSSAATIHKFDTTGAIQWSRAVANASFCGVKYNSTDGCIYVVGSANITNNGMVIYKFDTSGTVQWQRSLFVSAGGSVTTSMETDNYGYGWRPLAISADGKIYVTAQIRNGTSGLITCFVAKLPSDGSLTGTYSGVGAYSFTYAVSSTTVTTASTAGGLNTNANISVSPVASGSFTPPENVAAGYSTTKVIL